MVSRVLLRHLLRLFQRMRVEHQEDGVGRDGPVGIDLQFKHTDQITADRLNSLQKWLSGYGFLCLAGVINPRYFDHIIEVFFAGAFPAAGAQSDSAKTRPGRPG